MKIKFKSYVEIKPNEWLLMAVFVIIICLIMNGRMDDAMQFLWQCIQMMKK
jgi:hypothetical protein